MYFLNGDEKLLKIILMIVSNNVSNNIREEFVSKQINNKRHLKTKKTSYSYETTDFHDK